MECVRDDMKRSDIVLAVLLFIAVLASGGFYTFLNVPMSVFLLGYLLYIGKKQGLKLYGNICLVAVSGIFAGYVFSWFWAVDRGMSLLGSVRFFPVILYTILLMQMEPESARTIYRTIPWMGVTMTVLCLILRFVPAISDYIVVKGRFAGSFQYANTYALFLLVGLTILLMEEKLSWQNLMGEVILVFGILASGSRTSFLLMLGLMAFICIWRRNGYHFLATAGVIAAGLGLSALAAAYGTAEADRYLTTASETGTLLVRLLYYKDAVPVILKHPGGLGYLGYYLLQSSFQTGVYSVRFVHNELLQLLLDVGWIPTMLFCIALFQSFFRKGTELWKRLILFLVCAHAMMDFDLQFLSIWFILIPVMDLWRGNVIQLRWSELPFAAAAIVFSVWCGWMGVADYLYTIHNVPGCLQVAPSYTMALIDSLSDLKDVALLEQRADEILKLNSDVSVAHSAKGNAAYGKGDIVGMMAEKEEAIRLAPYYLEGYLDYFDKLEQVEQRYEQMGDIASAEACRKKMMEIPEMLDRVKKNTSPISWKIQHKPELELPIIYQNKLKNLVF